MSLPIWASGLVLISYSLIIAAIWLILREKKQTSKKITWLLLIGLVSIMVWITADYIQLQFFTPDENLAWFAFIAALGNIVILIGLASIAIFADLLVFPTPPLKRLIYLSALISIVGGISLASVVSGVMDNKDIVLMTRTLSDILNLTIMISVIYFARQDLNTLLQENLGPMQRLQLKYLKTALYVGILGLIPIIAIATFFNPVWLSLSFAVVSLAMFFIVRGYAMDPRVAFILPYKTYLAMVVNKEGVLKYEKEFIKIRDQEATFLISMALSAVSSMMSEYYQSEVYPNFIDFGKEKLILKWANDFFVVVFTENDSMLVRNAVEEAVKKIKERYGDKLSAVMTDSASLELNDIFADAFYFVFHE